MAEHRRRTPWEPAPPVPTVSARTSEDDLTNVAFALAIFVAVASAAGIAWLAEAGAERSFLGMRSECVLSLEEDGYLAMWASPGGRSAERLGPGGAGQCVADRGGQAP